jgi:DNA-binding IclR family transcriptional regulator
VGDHAKRETILTGGAAEISGGAHASTADGAERDAGESSAAVKSALRVLLIVELLTKFDRGLTFAEMHEHLELPKSSLHGLLKTMTARGHLLVDERTRAYRLGVRFWEAGQAFLRSLDLTSICHPYLEAAREGLDETVQLAVLDGLENVYIAKVEADQRLKLVSEVGSRLPAHATGLGKALLAGLDDAELAVRLRGARLERFTPRTIVDKRRLLKVLDEVRELGYAQDDGEYTPGVSCVAVPVRNHEGRVIASMSASVPAVRVDEAMRGRMIDVLVRQADLLSRALGHRGAG